MAQMVRNMPAMQETCIQFLGWEDLLEKGMATHSSILAWRIPWAKEPDRLHGVTKSPWSYAESDMTKKLTLFINKREWKQDDREVKGMPKRKPCV